MCMRNIPCHQFSGAGAGSAWLKGSISVVVLAVVLVAVVVNCTQCSAGGATFALQRIEEGSSSSIIDWSSYSVTIRTTCPCTVVLKTLVGGVQWASAMTETGLFDRQRVFRTELPSLNAAFRTNIVFTTNGTVEFVYFEDWDARLRKICVVSKKP